MRAVVRTEIREAVESALTDLFEPPPPWLTLDELAAHFRCSRTTVNRWRSQGMPHVMVGESPRFQLEPVTQWLAEHTDNNTGRASGERSE